MNCGGKVYKGETVTISVPFDVSGYTDLTISYSTTGDSKIVKGEDEVTIEDGFISYTFTGDELDLLPDGVIYYTINYEVDGTDYVASTNTNLYLKTPAGYSGKTAEDYYQEGYEDGLEACSGDTPCDCSSAYTEGYHDGEVIGKTEGYTSGYTDGYNQGLEDCPECDCTSAVTEAYQEGFEEGFMSGASSTDCSEAANEAYEIGFSSGYSAGLEDCPECDCTSAVTEAYNSGRQSGYTDGYAQGEEAGHDAGYSEGFDAGFESGQTNCDCESAVTEAYQSGYTAGLADCSGSTCNLQSGTLVLDENFSGFDTVYPDAGYDGFESVDIQDGGYGPAKYDEGLNDGFNSGYQSAVTDTFPIAYQSGYTDGLSQSECASAYTYGFEQGFVSGNQRIVTFEIDFTDCVGFSYVRVEPGYGYANINGVECATFNIESSQDMKKLYISASTSESALSYLETTLRITYGHFPGVSYFPYYAKINGLYDIRIATAEKTSVGADTRLKLNFRGEEIIFNDSTYEAGWNSGWTSGLTSGFSAGYASGLTDCQSHSCSLEEKTVSIGGTGGTIYPSSGYDGMSEVRVDAKPARQGGYKDGLDSVIQSFFTGNTLGNGYNYGYVVAYYYTPTSQDCVITGYDQDCPERPTDIFTSMSVDGGDWETPTLYYYLTAGWHQIRFLVKDKYLHYAFNHNFASETTNSGKNALKAVSIPEQYYPELSAVTGLIGTFKMNDGIRILSTSLQTYGGAMNGNALSGATNLNVIFSHYTGNENVDIRSDVANGVLFYPQGKASTHSGTLSGWTHIELF